MGQLILPAGSAVYLDVPPVIYSVEKHADFEPVLQQFWIDAKSGKYTVTTSELTLLEVLVQPIRLGRHSLIATYETFLLNSDIQLIPIDAAVLREAARLRATQNFKTPDAIHAASAILSNCTHLVTNDPSFRRLTTINVTILSDLA